MGVLYDARNANQPGYCCTIFLTNLYAMPHSEAEFLTLPRVVYDTFDELADAGWCVD